MIVELSNLRVLDDPLRVIAERGFLILGFFTSADGLDSPSGFFLGCAAMRVDDEDITKAGGVNWPNTLLVTN